MANWQEDYKRKVISFTDAARLIKSGDFISTALGVGSCSPQFFDAVLDRADELEKVFIMDSLQLKPSRLYDPVFMCALEGRINYIPTFGIDTIRNSYANNCDYLVNTVLDGADKSAHRSTVFIMQVTPPDSKGFVNLSLTNDYSLDAVRKGRAQGKLRLVIGEVNDQMPIVFGNNWLHVSEFDHFIENSCPPPVFKRKPASKLEDTIASYVLELINDGDTIQMGIGGISEAVVAGLTGKHGLGVHSEMFPMGLPQLVEQGIVDNMNKPLHKGVSMSTFCLGDESMYAYVAENPACEIHPAAYTNHPSLIARIPNMIAINMALMIDLSGQITAEGIGHRMISGPGGQFDFAVGATWSEGGKAITLLRSARQRKDGSLISAVVPELPEGTPVTVPRMYANYIVTEYGVADLRYKSRRERAQALIEIAHPDLRGELHQQMKFNFYPGVSIN
ncbi:MAG: acetyl-CoA hydrolase/transferase family protein [Methylocystaceae bacterium]